MVSYSAVCANAFSHQLEPERQRRRLDRARPAAAGNRAGSTTTSTPRKFFAAARTERRPADVDLLDQRLERRRRIRGGLRERIQVDDDDIDEADAVARERREIVGTIAPREDAAVQRRVQRLHAAVHHLGKAGDVGDAGHREAGIGERARRAAGRDQLESARGEAARRDRRSRSCQKRSARLLA